MSYPPSLPRRQRVDVSRRSLYISIVFTVLGLLCLGLIGCVDSKPGAAAKAKATETAGVLFTVDGVTVYRFSDAGRYHYFAVRTGRQDTVSFSTWSERHGKVTRTYNEEIPLIAER